VALANKNARIIWALLTRGDNYWPAVPADRGNPASLIKRSLLKKHVSGRLVGDG
jgi:hypothetical protein